MQFREWLKRNMITASEVAEAWGVSGAYLSNCMTGKTWPSKRILVRSYILSNGQVSTADWAECHREALTAEGILKEGEHIRHGRTRTQKTVGAPPGKRKAERDHQENSGAPA